MTVIETSRDDKDLIMEANRISYSLHSIFLHRKLKELGYLRVINDIEAIVKRSHLYSWEDRKSWDITHIAWETIEKEKIDFIRVFVHPKILVENPGLIRYYRNVAAIPLKGVQYLAFNVTDYENGKIREIEYSQALALVKLFNSHISSIIESKLRINFEDIRSLLFSSEGITIDGSWKNEIDEEAKITIQKYLMRMCINEKLIYALIDRQNCPVEFEPGLDYLSNISLYRGIKLKSKKSILFSKKPDIIFIDKSGKPIVVIEIKWDTDPAGALERLGAIKKSFDQARRQNPQVITILMVSCITREMGTRLTDDALIDSIFNLTSIINDMDKRKEFLDKIKEILEKD